jgi:hypothetical protein
MTMATRGTHGRCRQSPVSQLHRGPLRRWLRGRDEAAGHHVELVQARIAPLHLHLLHLLLLLDQLQLQHLDVEVLARPEPKKTRF